MSTNYGIKNYPSVRAVCHQAALNAPSGISAKDVAPLVGKNYQTMMSELVGAPGHKLGVDILLPLMAATGSDAPVDMLARERGGVFVHLPVVRASSKSMTLQLATTIRECGELAALTAQQIVDGKVTPAELEEFRKENREAIAALLEMENLMELAAESGQELG